MPERYLGRTLGKYRIDALIGSGGFAWVYKAYDPELDVPVALKILKPQYAGDEVFEERFRREASTAARLRHPNIVKIFSVGREDDAVYFAMDYLPQGLADRLEVMTTLPEPMLIRTGVDVASAIGFAHRQGVIHRDIKTDNILFDDHGNAVVADFGIARAVSGYAEQTGTNMVVGTPQYFSPEQARGLQLDGRADVYSLGITLFRAATGVLPFTGDDWYEIARQHVEDRPPKPRAINPSISPSLEDVILRCIEKEPGNRFESAEHLCHALAALMHEPGASTSLRALSVSSAKTARAPSFAGFGRRARRIERGVWIGAGAAVLLLAGALVARTHSGAAEPARRAGLAAGGPSAAAVISRGSTGGETPTAARTSRRLTVRAPAGASVAVNGTSVGTGPWAADTLAPGRYEITATLKPMAGCPTTTAKAVVTLRRTDTREVQLNPRSCGELRLDAKPAGATYTLSSLAGDRPLRGTAPVDSPLLLPVGSYRLSVEARFCAPFHHAIRVYANRHNAPVRVRLICN